MNNNLTKYIFITATALIILVILSTIKSIVNPPEVIFNTEVVSVRDTTYITKVDTFKVGFPVVRTIYRDKIDTITITQAFEKSIDTTFVDSSRIQISYLFPQDTFKIKLQTKIKEILQKDTIKTYITLPAECKTDWTTPVVTGATGLVLGVVVGVLISK